jgi:hypothetical protein
VSTSPKLLSLPKIIPTYIRVNQPKALVTTEGNHMIIAIYICVNQPKALVTSEVYPMIITTTQWLSGCVCVCVGGGDKGITLEGADAWHFLLCPECNCPFVALQCAFAKLAALFVNL